MISLRHKLWLGFGALLLIVLLVSLLSFVVMTRYSRALERVLRENYDSALYCDQMKAAIDHLNLRALTLIWNPAHADQIDQAAEQARFDANLGDEFNNLTLPGEPEHTRHLADVWRQYQAGLDQLDAAPAAQRPALYQSSLLPLFNDIHQTAQWISDANMSNLVSVDGQVKRTLLEVRNALLALAVAGVVAAAVVVGAAGTSILHPLANLTRSARQIESGDLDLDLTVRARDEIGILADAFNSMASKLREFRRLDHDRLLRTQQTTQLAIDSLPDAVFIVGPDGTVEISNRTARTHFGIDPGLRVEQLGRQLKWLLPIYDAVKHNQTLDQPSGYRSAIQLFEGGQERFLLPRAVPMIGAENRVIGVCVILVDVTRLRSADEARASLVSTVSHELRTPLTSIRMALNLMSNPQFGSLAAKQASLLEAARQDSDRLHRIIENLLNMSRVESGRAQFQFRSMSPAEIVANAVDPMRPAFASKQLVLAVSVAPRLPDVFADPAAIASALTNLLSNAMKFTPTGGDVSVSAEMDRDMVCFTVSDTGPGIPDQYADRIFEKFFRVPSKDGPSGAGLGLAIAKDIIEAHGGTIQLCRNKTPGSAFRIILRPHETASGPPQPV
jgi:signal transduction histidine kinase/HAMP domain-containing protein